MSATKKTITDNATAYDENLETWTRNRAVRSGAKAVKAGGETYLPRTSEKQKDQAYLKYKARAYFYPATGRTVDAYTGLIFRKPPQVELPSAVAGYADDIDLQGNTLLGFAEKATDDVVVVARGGILVEMPVRPEGELTKAQAESANLRPYLTFYPAESIRDWRTGRVGGKTALSFVKLFERVAVETENIFQEAFIDQYRVLRINELGQYEVIVYREAVAADSNGIAEWVETSRSTPLKAGKEFSEIPFVFLGSRSASSDVQESLINDIVDVNLSHFINSADYENALHWTGSPTPVFSGQFAAAEDGSQPTEIIIGSSSGIHFQDADGKAEYLEFKGDGLEGGLGKAMDRKEKHMALLGSRVLMDERKLAEAAETARTHRAGEASVLASLANAVSDGFKRALKILTEWAGADSSSVVFKLNTDFVPEGMSAQDIQALMLAWQGGAISKQTLFENLQAGEIIRPGKTFEEEQAEIDEEPPDIPAPAPVPPDPDEEASPA